MFGVRQVPLPPMAILDFDIESRPLGWLGGDFVHQEPTAIAWAWMDEPHTAEAALLTTSPRSAGIMLREFKRQWDAADMVVGHYIRSYDVGQLNAAMIEQGLPTLGEKLTHDTKSDLVKHWGMSKSQENLAAILGIDAPKVHMNVALWREANRLTAEGKAQTAERAVGDVLQNMELYAELKRKRLMTMPKLWKPGE